MGQETDILCCYINLIAGQQEYSSRQAGITAGIVLAVLVPILLGLVCIAYQLFVRRRKDPVEYKFKDTPPVR
jgi:predicted Na+-dependent transporter